MNKRRRKRRKKTAGQTVTSKLMASAKARAKRKGLYFGLASHAAQIAKRICNGTCELSGLPFNFAGGPYAPSIDRIICKGTKREKGYTLRNTRVVLWALNCAFGNWGRDTVMQIMGESLKTGATLWRPLQFSVVSPSTVK